jgi:hypothetical protein
MAARDLRCGRRREADEAQRVVIYYIQLESINKYSIFDGLAVTTTTRAMTSATGSSPLTEADEDVHVPVEAGPEGTEVAEAVEEVEEPVVVEAVVEELETPAEPEVVPMEVEEVVEEVQEVEKVEERVPTPPAPPPRAITPPPAPVDDLPSVVEAELPPTIPIVMIPAPPAAPIASTSIIPALPTVIPPSPLKRRLSSPPPLAPTLDAFEDPTSAAWKAAKEASQWNGLLRWARRARGPQWDWASGM